MNFQFVKMHSQGNSYIYFDLRESGLPSIDLHDLAIKASNKNFGIGSDGIVLILADTDADASMRIFNIDGSEGILCGSAVKSMTALMSRKEDFLTTKFSIKTKAGIVSSELLSKDDNFLVQTDLSSLNTLHPDGSQQFKTGEITQINKVRGMKVNIGNPHFVIFANDQTKECEEFDLNSIERVGSMIENHSLFPEGINVEMVKIVDRNRVVARVWERGSGQTLACGSGALAIAFAGLKRNYLGGRVEVVFPGGSKFVQIDIEKNQYCLSGEVEFIASGTYNYSVDSKRTT